MPLQNQDQVRLQKSETSIEELNSPAQSTLAVASLGSRRDSRAALASVTDSIGERPVGADRRSHTLAIQKVGLLAAGILSTSASLST